MDDIEVPGSGRFGNPNTDKEGWIIPPPRWWPREQPPEEARQQKRLVTLLRRHGWQLTLQASCYTRDGERRIPDIVASHAGCDSSLGAIEVKGAISTPRETADALKQAIDYTECKVQATGKRIQWGAIWPFIPAKDIVTAAGMWGAADFAAVAFKVCCFVEEDDFGQQALSLDEAAENCPNSRVLLMYTRQQRIWCSERRFQTNAVHMLTGKRQVGGCRRNV